MLPECCRKREGGGEKVHIHEAVKTALEENKMIIRASAKEPESEVYAVIRPTNSYDACILIVRGRDANYTRACRCWNPTADDLMADDWTVITE